MGFEGRTDEAPGSGVNVDMTLGHRGEVIYACAISRVITCSI